jgi:hypothetical protein
VFDQQTVSYQRSPRSSTSVRERVVEVPEPPPLATVQEKAAAELARRVARAREAGTPMSPDQMSSEFERLVNAERKIRQEGVAERVSRKVVREKVVDDAVARTGVGVELDQAVVTSAPDGSAVLDSFVPNWRNAIAGPLRRAGFKEKEISTFLESHALLESRRLESLMDGPVQALAKMSRAQFIEGCL